MTKSTQLSHKSRGGKAPRKTKQAALAHQFLDHNVNLYTVVGGTPTTCSNPSVIRKFSIHLYCLGPLSPSPEAVGKALLASSPISGWGNARNYWPRVDVYAPLGSIEECVEHHRREKAFRQNAAKELRRNAAISVQGSNAEAEDRGTEAVARVRGREPLPHIVPTWCVSAKFWDERNYNDRYRSFILVVPEECQTWRDVENKGLWLVRFDQDITPDMETTTYDLSAEDDNVVDDPTGCVEIQKVDHGPPVSIKRACIPEVQHGFNERAYDEGSGLEVPKRWQTADCQISIYDAWVRLTSALTPDCVYRPVSCNRCYDDKPHDDCEAELDEHYFDEDGQCIACRRASEYRRRSKRIANLHAIEPM